MSEAGATNRVTITIALKSGSVFQVEGDEGSGSRPGYEVCQQFFDAFEFGKMVTLRFGQHIFYCREIERISFLSPGDAP